MRGDASHWRQLQCRHPIAAPACHASALSAAGLAELSACARARRGGRAPACLVDAYPSAEAQGIPFAPLALSLPLRWLCMGKAGAVCF